MKKIFLLLCALLVWASFKIPSREKPPKNVLFIVVDDLNTMLGCYGDPNVKSPNIDRLAARGVRFDRGYCQYPLCGPSRASFLSGKRPENLGIYNLTTHVRTVLPQGVLMPEYFRQKGYFTAGAGKVFHNVKMGDAQSWDFYEDGLSKDPQDIAALKNRAEGDGKPAWQMLESDGALTRDGMNTQTILKYMESKTKENKPFFLAMGYHKPHLPWVAPKRFFDMYDTAKIKIAPEPAMKDIPNIAMQTELTGFDQPSTRVEAMKAYFACISSTDYQIGLLLDQLDKLNLWNNTIVVLVGDNGFHLGDHGGLWAKLSAFDNATRVPLIFAGGNISKGKVVKTPVELVDIYPSLLEVCGFEKKAHLDGVSLANTLTTSANLPEMYAKTMVFHYDTTTRKDVLSQTIVAENWRYTAWNQGEKGSEFYVKKKDKRAEYVNQINNPKLQSLVKKGADMVKSAQPIKAGKANRPRALVTAAEKAE